MAVSLSDFDFELPEERIAIRPLKPKGEAKLLHYEKGLFYDRHVANLIDLLHEGDLLVLNNTRVIAARLRAKRRRETAQGPVSAHIELTLMNPTAQGHWRAMAKPLRKVLVG